VPLCLCGIFLPAFAEGLRADDAREHVAELPDRLVLVQIPEPVPPLLRGAGDQRRAVVDVRGIAVGRGGPD
jgi:hypothetical protein